MDVRIWALLLVLGGVIAGWRLYFSLRRNAQGFGSSLWEAFLEAWWWLPGSNKVRDLEQEKTQREAFLKRRRERSRSNLTDDF
jgi:hypothetical protein